MTVDEDLFEVQRRHWRRSLLIGSGIISGYLVLDLQMPDGKTAAAWRLGWIASLLVTAALQRPGRPVLARAATHFAGVATGIAVPAVVYYTGGTTGPRFGFLLALPLTVLLLLPHLPSAAVVTGIGCVAGGFVVIARDGRDLWFTLEWTVLAVALLVLAILGSVAFRRVWVSEVESQRARRTALEQLAESEERRAQLERLAVVGRLAAGVAHEVNNPLSYVKASLAFVRRDLAQPSPEVQEALGEALHGIERIAQIVEDLSGLSRDASQDVGTTSVEAALTEAWRMCSPRLGGVRGTLEVRSGLPRVRGSHRLLVQALVNLLANAGDAAESALDPANRWVTAAASVDGDAVSVVIEDGGPGLAAEVTAHLFEPFFSTKGTKGTGIGLALVREQVTRCGGSVAGGNREGGGARFVVRLQPALPDATACTSATPSPTYRA